MNKQQRAAVTVGVTTSFITTFAGSALNLAIPEMSVFFNMGAASAGWIVTIYMLIVAAFAVPCGKVADSTDRRKVLIIGILTFALCSVIITFLTRTWMLILFRAIQGIGASLIFATYMPIAISPFEPNKRGRAIGIVTAGTYCGLALGPALGGFLNASFGWASIFYFGVLICILALCVIIKEVPKSEKTSSISDMKLDIAGVICYICMITALIYGLSNKPVITPLAIVFGFIFAKVELHANNPMIDVRIFKKDLIYTLSNAAALLNYMSTYALGYLSSIYLQVVMGFSSRVAGLVLMTQPLVQAVLSPRSGRLSDRYQAYKIAAIGQTVCTAALFFYIFVGESSPVWFVVGILAIAGTGIAFFSSPNTNVVMSRVDPADFGVANSVLSTMRTAGQSIGMAILTIIINMTVGNISLYEIPAADLTTTMHYAFAIFTGLAALGAAFSFIRGNFK